MLRSLVSLEAGDAFPTGGAPPGHELADYLAEAARAGGFVDVAVEEREGWAWDLRSTRDDVSVECIVGLTDDPPIQWQAHSFGRVSLGRRLFKRRESEAARAEVLARWCAIVHEALRSHPRVSHIRWYDQADFERDHGDTWAETPT